MQVNIFKNKKRFNEKTLKDNNISILTFDERWINISSKLNAPSSIKKEEKVLNTLIKKEAMLFAEKDKISPDKKKCMDKIVLLTKDAYENGNDSAKKEMASQSKEIERLNKRSEQIEDELYNIRNDIKAQNLKILEKVVDFTYKKLHEKNKRIKELDLKIRKTREQLRLWIDEKAGIEEDYTQMYTYFHSILGPEQMSLLDLEFIKEEEKDEALDPETNEGNR